MTDDPGRCRKVQLVVVSVILGAVLGWLATARQQASPAPPVMLPASPAVVEQRTELSRRTSSAVYCVLVPLLLWLTLWLTSQERLVSGEITATATVLVLALALRGPVRRRGRWTVAVLVVLAVLAVSLDQILILGQIDRSVSDVGGLLLQSALFIVFVGGLAWLAASWSMVVFAEVGALLLIALMLGFVSFSGISYFTAPVSAPEPDDATLVVFAADPATQMEVVVKYYPEDSTGTTLLSLQVRSTGSPDPRWGILLSEGLRFRPGEGRGPGVARTDLVDNYQVISGTEGTYYAGAIVGSFQKSSASRSVVSLPRISSDPLGLKRMEVVRLSTGFSAVRPYSLALSVDCGALDPLKTVTQATPPLAVPNQLAWRAYNELGPIGFATLDQGNEDRSRNVLFVVAILLGAAVACLVAALQVLLKAAHKPA